MPSVFVLDGARVSSLGAIAIPLAPGSRPRPTRGGYPEYGKPRGTQVQSIFSQITNQVPASLKGLGHAVEVGFGEISPQAKTGMLALGMLALVGLVVYEGGKLNRRRSLRGARRRRRR